MPVQRVERLTVEENLGEQLPFADEVGEVEIAGLADDLYHVEHDRWRTVGNGFEGKGNFESPSLGLGRVKLLVVAVAEMMMRGVEHDPPPLSVNLQRREPLAGDIYRADIRHLEPERLNVDLPEDALDPIQVTRIVAGGRAPPGLNPQTGNWLGGNCRPLEVDAGNLRPVQGGRLVVHRQGQTLGVRVADVTEDLISRDEPGLILVRFNLQQTDRLGEPNEAKIIEM